MSNSDNTPQETNILAFDISPSAHAVVVKQMHYMSHGIDALDGLSLILADAIDSEIGITGGQVTGLLKCVEFSLLTNQRKIIKALENNKKGKH